MNKLNTEVASDIVFEDIDLSSRRPMGMSFNLPVTGGGGGNGGGGDGGSDGGGGSGKDFAFMSVPHLHAYQFPLIVTVNGVVFSDTQYNEYIAWIDSQIGTVEFGEYSRQAITWLQWELGKIGIAMYDSYDIYKDWELFKFQNLTDTPQDITIEVLSNTGDKGISILPRSLIGSSNNPTITTSMPITAGGFNKVVFTLAPCARPDLVNITPEEIRLAPYTGGDQRLVASYQDGFLGALYSFSVNGVELQSPINGNGNRFTLTTQDGLDEVYETLLDAGIVLNAKLYVEGLRKFLDCNFTPVRLDKPYLLEITQNLVHSKGVGSEDETVYKYSSLYPTNRVVTETVTGTLVTHSTYVYDPIDLAKEPPIDPEEPGEGISCVGATEMLQQTRIFTALYDLEIDGIVVVANVDSWGMFYWCEANPEYQLIHNISGGGSYEGAELEFAITMNLSPDVQRRIRFIYKSGSQAPFELSLNPTAFVEGKDVGVCLDTKPIYIESYRTFLTRYSKFTEVTKSPTRQFDVELTYGGNTYPGTLYWDADSESVVRNTFNETGTAQFLSVHMYYISYSFAGIPLPLALEVVNLSPEVLDPVTIKFTETDLIVATPEASSEANYMQNPEAGTYIFNLGAY